MGGKQHTLAGIHGMEELRAAKSNRAKELSSAIRSEELSVFAYTKIKLRAATPP